MGNRHHLHVLNIGGAEVERVSDRTGRSYQCRACSSDHCRHVKQAREADMLHLREDEARNARSG